MTDLEPRFEPAPPPLSPGSAILILLGAVAFVAVWNVTGDAVAAAMAAGGLFAIQPNDRQPD